MRLLLPLGLLALVGILILLLIYIIKPNFQQKLISSTYIWKLSLKFKKRKIPISKLRNILLVACQVLIITAISLILSKTVWVLKEQITQPEVVLIIDSSASMRTGDEVSSRYIRAVDKAVKEANKTFDRDGIVSVIVTGGENTYLAERAYKENRDQVISEMDALLTGDTSCTYGSVDMSAAVAMTDRVLTVNPNAKIYLYTDSTYAGLSDNISLVNVAEEEEWNAAILDATATYEDNYYTFRVEVACYGRDKDLTLRLTVNGANAESSEDTAAGDRSWTVTVPCMNDGVYTAIFKYVPAEEEQAFLDTLDDTTVFYNIPVGSAEGQDERVYAYQSVFVTIDEQDSMPQDNAFSLYGGLKETVKVQYYSSGTDPKTGASLGPNIFFQQALAAIQKIYANRWNIEITEVKKGNPYATEGFDFYIFEHEMPTKLPADGVVFLADPMSAPADAGFEINGYVDCNGQSVFLTSETPHPILSGMTPTNISVSRYTRLKVNDTAYTGLLSYGADPLLLVKNEKEARVAVMPFSLHYSNLPLLVDFPLLINNLFGYFFPTTVDSMAIEAGEDVSLNCRGEELTVSDGVNKTTFNTFPASMRLYVPGSYTVSQTTYAGKDVVETIYVRMPRAESNIFAQEGAIRSPYYEIDESDYYADVLLYIACALVALLTLEWYLQHRESSL